jgi:hypothetical protein
MNTVHEIEKKALPEWFKIKKGILATMVHPSLCRATSSLKSMRSSTRSTGIISSNLGRASTLVHLEPGRDWREMLVPLLEFINSSKSGDSSTIFTRNPLSNSPYPPPAMS